MITSKVLPKAQYGGRHTVTMLPGGGIGPEMMQYVKEVFRCVSYVLHSVQRSFIFLFSSLTIWCFAISGTPEFQLILNWWTFTVTVMRIWNTPLLRLKE